MRCGWPLRSLKLVIGPRDGNDLHALGSDVAEGFLVCLAHPSVPELGKLWLAGEVEKGGEHGRVRCVAWTEREAKAFFDCRLSQPPWENVIAEYAVNRRTAFGTTAHLDRCGILLLMTKKLAESASRVSLFANGFEIWRRLGGSLDSRPATPPVLPAPLNPEPLRLLTEGELFAAHQFLGQHTLEGHDPDHVPFAEVEPPEGIEDPPASFLKLLSRTSSSDWIDLSDIGVPFE